jgi:hypothetical protein
MNPTNFMKYCSFQILRDHGKAYVRLAFLAMANPSTLYLYTKTAIFQFGVVRFLIPSFGEFLRCILGHQLCWLYTSWDTVLYIVKNKFNDFYSILLFLKRNEYQFLERGKWVFETIDVFFVYYLYCTILQ